MKLLKELTNQDFGLKNKKVDEYRLRKAARAVVFDKEGKVAILYASAHGYHKIAGGGVEAGEDIKMALAREIYEETGCTATVKNEVGMIIEFRDDIKLLQISYCYIAQAKKHGNPHFTKKEKEAGFELKWFSVNEALKKFKKDDISHYNTKFMSTRDATFLKETQRIVKNKK